MKLEDLAQHEADSRRLFKLLQKKSHFELSDRAGFGAAGGIALGLSAFFPVSIEEGAQFFFKKVGMSGKIKNADYVITGEGRFDSQSSGGKGSYELLQLAKNLDKKIFLITSGAEGTESGFDKVIRLQDLDFNSSNLKENAERYLYQAVRRFIKEEIQD